MFGSFYAGTVIYGVSNYYIVLPDDYASSDGLDRGYYKRLFGLYGDILAGTIDELGNYKKSNKTSGDYSSSVIDGDNEYGVE